MTYPGAKRHFLAMTVVLLLIAGGLAWSPAVQACTVTTTVSQPSNVTATVNEEGILLRWDAAPEADKVHRYEIYRGVGVGATPSRYGGIQVVAVYDVNTGTFTYPATSPMDMTDYADMLIGGETYVYAVAFARRDNCGNLQIGERSESVSVTYQPEQ